MNPGYRLFLETLSSLCAQGASGVLHFYTVDNQYGRIGLQAGEVIHITLHNLRGLTALPMLLSASISSHRFEPGAQPTPLDELLDTPDLLAMLGCAELAPPPPPPVAPPPPPPVAAPAPAAAPQPAGPKTTATGLESEPLRLIEEELQHELGPMAGALVQECLPRARNAAHLIELLADQLMPDTGEKFLARVSERLLQRPV